MIVVRAAGVSIELCEKVEELLLEQIIERLKTDVEAPGTSDGYLDVDAAAEFLSCPKSRIYQLNSAGRIPCHKDGSRLLFLRSELREFVEAGGAKCP